MSRRVGASPAFVEEWSVEAFRDDRRRRYPLAWRASFPTEREARAAIAARRAPRIYAHLGRVLTGKRGKATVAVWEIRGGADERIV